MDPLEDSPHRTATEDPAAVERAKSAPICPVCRHPVSAAARRCSYCLADLTTSPVTRGEARPIEPQDGGERPGWSSLDPRSRLVEAAQRIVMLAAAAWVIYAQFFAGPGALLEPADRSITVAANPSTWPTVGGDLGASRSTSAPSHLQGEIVWTKDFGVPLSVPLIAGDDALYVALSDGRLVALEPEQGAEDWSQQFQYELRSAPPTLAGDRLYVLKRDGRVAALNAEDGAPLWEQRFQAAFAAAPAVADGVVYAYYGFEEADRSFTAPIFGIDAATGERLWEQRVSTVFPLIPPVADRDYVAIVASSRVLIFDRATGNQNYWYPFSRRARPTSLALVEGTVYAVSPRQVVAISAATTEPWHYSVRTAWLRLWGWGLAPRPPAPEAEWIATAPPADALPLVVLTDRIIVAGAGGEIRAYARATGETLWDAEFGPLSGPPVSTADGLILIQGDRLLLIDPITGREQDRRTLPVDDVREVVVTSGGTYLVTGDGVILALREST